MKQRCEAWHEQGRGAVDHALYLLGSHGPLVRQERIRLCSGTEDELTFTELSLLIRCGF